MDRLRALLARIRHFCVLIWLACVVHGTGYSAAQDDLRYPLFGPEVVPLPTVFDEESWPLPTPDDPTPPLEVVPAPEPSSPSKDTAAKVDEVILPDTGPLPWWKPWEGSFEMGMNGTRGNMDTFNLRIGAKAKRVSPHWNHTAEFTHINKTNDTQTIAYSLLFDSRAEYLIADSPWSLHVHELTEYDEFKAFKVRLSADIGVGYQWLKTDATKLLTRFGPSLSREIGGPNNKVTPELTSGVEYEHAFNPRNKIAFKTDYFPSLIRISDYRINTRASWELVVAPAWGMSLKTSIIDRYDSTPGLNKRRSDLDYSVLAMWSF